MIARLVLLALVACGAERATDPRPEPEVERPVERQVDREETPRARVERTERVENTRREPMSLEPFRNSLAVGEQFSCALREGRAYCWGDASDGVVPGDENQTRPVLVPGVRDAIAIELQPTNQVAAS